MAFLLMSLGRALLTTTGGERERVSFLCPCHLIADQWQGQHFLSGLAHQLPLDQGQHYYATQVVCVFKESVSLCTPNCHYVDQSGLELKEFCLPLPLEC